MASPIGILQSYIDYVCHDDCTNLNHVSFRNKDKTISAFAPYIMSFDYVDSNGEKRKRYITLRDSGYYRMFMGMVGYRDSCYDCRFASVNKPADLTLGDYYISDSKSSSLSNLQLDKNKYYSCIIAHTEKGATLLDEVSLELHEIAVEDAVRDHEHLQYASLPTKIGSNLLDIFEAKGFEGLQRYIVRKNLFVDIAKKIRSLLHC